MTIQVTKLQELASSVSEHHKHIVISELNDKYFAKLAVNSKPYPWHYHSNSDELLVVLEGKLIVETRDGEKRELELFDSIFIPCGMEHRTSPVGRAVNLVIENMDTDTVFTE